MDRFRYPAKVTHARYGTISHPMLTSCDDYTQYLTQCKAASKYDTGVNVEPNDQIVTLSTCTSRGDNYRFVAQGKLIYSEYK